MIKSKDNKADVLPDHVVNIIIGVIGFVFVVCVLGVIIWTIFKADNTDDAKAQAELEKLGGVIKNLQSSTVTGIGIKEHVILGPGEWIIAGWSDSGYNTVYCSQQKWKNCICWCDGSLFPPAITLRSKLTAQNIMEICDKKPICAGINAKTVVIDPDHRGNEYNDYITMTELFDAYVGNLEIAYDKAIDKITITPKKV